VQPCAGGAGKRGEPVESLREAFQQAVRVRNVLDVREQINFASFATPALTGMAKEGSLLIGSFLVSYFRPRQLA
jgi:hypothetical protein